MVVIVLAVVFYFANVPDIKMEDDYHLDDGAAGVSHSIWTHPHFVMAVAAQFLYVAAQAGIFSFFINYMTSQVPAIPAATWRLVDWLRELVTETGTDGGLLHQRQGRCEPGLAGIRLLPGRPVHAARCC